MLTQTPPLLLEPAFIRRARLEWAAATDHPDHDRVMRLLSDMAECVRQMNATASECEDAALRECVTGRVGCFAALEDTAGDIGMTAWAWTDGRDSRLAGNRLDTSRAWRPEDLGAQ